MCYLNGVQIMMKKKVLILLVAALLATVPAMAAYEPHGAVDEGSFSVGLNLGTNTGVGFKYGFGSFDLVGNVGFDFLSFNVNPFRYGIGLDIGVNFEVYDIDLGGKHHMPVTVGAMLPLGFVITENGFAFNLAAAVTAGLEYQIPDVPISFYLRLGVGPAMSISSGGVSLPPLVVAVVGNIGVMYVF